MKKINSILFLIISITQSLAQGTFTYQPQHPKAGDTITFSYTPPNNSFYTPEAYVVKYIGMRESLFDVPLIKKGNTYAGSVAIDTSVNLLAFGFKNADKWDNNFNNGFFIFPYNDNNRVKPFSYLNVANFFDFYGPYKLGLKRDDNAVIFNYEKEFSLYPENRDLRLIAYLNALSRLDKAKAKNLADVEIDHMLKRGLTTRNDYEKIQSLYSIINQPEKADYYKKLRLEKIPLDNYNVSDLRQILQQEKNISAKEKLLNEFLEKKKESPDRTDYTKLIETLRSNLANDYLENRNWEAFKSVMDSTTPKWGTDFIYSKASKRAILDSATLGFARYFGKQAVTISKNVWENVGVVPNYMTRKEFVQTLKTNYGFYADNYAQILFKSKMYEDALPYAKEAALNIEEGNNIDYNSNYATIASKALPVETYKPQLEKFVKDGKEDENIVSILKEVYIAQGNNTTEFNEYINTLKIEADEHLMKELKKQKVNLPSLPFVLKDINGKLVQLSDYKGKIVILDFWATWCVPCVASFPAMDALIQQYKNDTSIVFLFINTFQSEEDKIKAATDFIKKNKYDFNLLFDTENKVAMLYNVNIIPAKFIIGKDGKIKFSVTGFKGDELLKKELNAMIKLVK